jgi:hypothetical protein
MAKEKRALFLYGQDGPREQAIRVTAEYLQEEKNNGNLSLDIIEYHTGISSNDLADYEDAYVTLHGNIVGRIKPYHIIGITSENTRIQKRTTTFLTELFSETNIKNVFLLSCESGQLCNDLYSEEGQLVVDAMPEGGTMTSYVYDKLSTPVITQIRNEKVKLAGNEAYFNINSMATDSSALQDFFNVIAYSGGGGHIFIKQDGELKHFGVKLKFNNTIEVQEELTRQLDLSGYKHYNDYDDYITASSFIKTDIACNIEAIKQTLGQAFAAYSAWVLENSGEEVVVPEIDDKMVIDFLFSRGYSESFLHWQQFKEEDNIFSRASYFRRVATTDISILPAFYEAIENLSGVNSCISGPVLLAVYSAVNLSAIAGLLTCVYARHSKYATTAVYTITALTAGFDICVLLYGENYHYSGSAIERKILSAIIAVEEKFCPGYVRANTQEWREHY